MNFMFQRRRSQFARGLALAGLVLLALPGSRPALAQEGAPSEYQVKAAFLYHFGQFVEWPTNAFAGDRAPLVIGVFGGDPFHGDLERLVANQNINGHPIVVRQIKALPDLPGCQILFITAAAKNQEHDVLNAVSGKSVLTVGETEGFCEAGGMINFVIEDQQVHFDINNAAAKAVGLKISSKLLALAQRPAQAPPK